MDKYVYVETINYVCSLSFVNERQISQYSQTLVFEHNSFSKAVRKPICSKAESYFPITNNKKEINLFYTPNE